MSAVITYANNASQCFCQVRLDNGERVLISIAALPSPSIKILKMGFWGFIPIGIIWQLEAATAGGLIPYVQKLLTIFAVECETMDHPLDAIRDVVLACKSVDEVRQLIEKREAA